MADDIIDDNDLATLAGPSHNNHTGSSRRVADANSLEKPKVQQLKPQGLGPRPSASVILVSARQKGNPALTHIRSVGWEYADIPADFVLGATTCALFLSLKYHRLHPEYVYGRIKALQGRYNLRILLTLVDIENHEEPLKELSKTSLINNVTVILAWSSQEAGRYLELYKNYEHAAPTSIKGIQSTTYSDQLVDFVTVPRGINKTDAVSLVATFGSIRTAVNARPEEVALISGWGEKKVQRWCKTVREPFRMRRAKKRGPPCESGRYGFASSLESLPAGATPTVSHGSDTLKDREVEATPLLGPSIFPGDPLQTAGELNADADKRSASRLTERTIIAHEDQPGDGPSSTEAPTAQENRTFAIKRKAAEDSVSEGIAAALSKLRKT